MERKHWKGLVFCENFEKSIQTKLKYKIVTRKDLRIILTKTKDIT